MRAAAADRLLTLHSRVWPAIVAMVCVLGIHSVRIFHRLIGPLYRFRWAFSKIGNGDLNFRVKIRKSDYLHREEEALNQMIEGLSERCELHLEVNECQTYLFILEFQYPWGKHQV